MLVLSSGFCAPVHAQAQEVTFEKFREDKKSPAILARYSIC